MNIALACAWDNSYAPLANITWEQNKKVYAERYGYLAESKIWQPSRISPGWQKMIHIKELFDDRSKNIEWVWATGCDSMITNFDINIKSIIDDNYHFIIGADINSINADSFLIRNSQEGNLYLNMILSKINEPRYNIQPTQFEQQVMMETQEEWKHIIKVVPQRVFNSYDYSYLPWPSPQMDKTGNHGNWMQGDFVIQWPAMTLQRRIKYAEHYSNCVMGVGNPLLW